MKSTWRLQDVASDVLSIAQEPFSPAADGSDHNPELQPSSSPDGGTSVQKQGKFVFLAWSLLHRRPLVTLPSYIPILRVRRPDRD